MSSEYRGYPGKRTFREWDAYQRTWPYLTRFLYRRLEDAGMALGMASTMALSREQRRCVCGYDEKIESAIVGRQHKYARGAVANASSALAVIRALSAKISA